MNEAQQKAVRLFLLLGQVVLTLGSAVYSLIKGPGLPDQIPTHWNAAGHIDAYGPKTTSLWMLPGMEASLLGLAVLVFLILRLTNAGFSMIGFFILTFALSITFSVLHAVMLHAVLGR